MGKIRTLITDDSVIYRSQIRAALQNLPWVETLGAVSNGRLAIDFIAKNPVDLLILDLEMPEMDGLQTLTELKNLKFKGKVLVFSSASKRGAEVTMDALRLGASDFIPKPSALDDANSATGTNPSERIRNALEPKISGLFPRSSISKTENHLHSLEIYPHVNWENLHPEIVIIGSSTGGPTVLEKIFSGLSAPINCPLVIVQHMPPIFTSTFAERLEKISGIPAVEAQQGMTLQNNKIYVAPGNYHLRLSGTPVNTALYLDQGPHINSVRPAVDPLFSTAAAIFKHTCMAFVLTGMGSDGKDGAIQVKRNGGAVIIQEEKSCIVYGMPGAVASVGAFDRVATPDEVIDILRAKITPSGSLSRFGKGA